MGAKFVALLGSCKNLRDIDRVVLATPEGSRLVPGEDASGYSLLNLAESTDAAIVKQVTQLLDRRPACLVVNSEREHALAVRIQKSVGHPVFLWRNWAGSERPQNDFGKWTHVNCFSDRESRHQLNRQGLALNNPYILDQPQLGVDSEVLMLEHGILSLFRPNREHPVSGKRRDDSHLKVACVTHFYCTEDNMASVFDMLERYSNYEPSLLDHLHFVIVDDGSPLEYEIPPFDLNLTWLRVNKDIPWNQAGARNLGALYARADKLLLSDLDHLFPEETFQLLLRARSPAKHLYKFRRLDPENGQLLRGHPNIFFTSRGLFFKHFGYDEEFGGHYGAEDFRFVKFLKGQGVIHRHLPRRFLCLPRPEIGLQSTHNLERDPSFNTPVDARKRMEMQWYGHSSGHSRMNLNFQWTVLRDSRRQAPLLPRDRLWNRTWLWRQLLPLGW